MAGGHCPFCYAERSRYGFFIDGRRLHQCEECSLLFRSELLKPLSGSLALTPLGFLRDVQVPRGLEPGEKVQLLAALELLAPGTRMLAIRCEDGEFLDLMTQRGVEVWTIDSDIGTHQQGHELTQRDLEGLAGCFDVCVLFDSLGLNAAPVRLLEAAWCALRKEGVLVLSFPSIQSWPARLFKQAWVEFQKPYLYYFDPTNIQNILFKAGFDQIVALPHRRVVTLKFLLNYLQDFPSRRVKLLRMLVTVLLPGPLKRRPMPVRGSHIVVKARKGPRGVRQKLSVIVPVYNERATFTEVMNRLLAKDIPMLDREIIVVESSSTDGTRSQVEKYERLTGVKVIYQDRPRGKGNAVREGLRHATGDFILIQDADLEYDLDDYDSLLAPLVNGQQAFVIGSRHSNGGKLWKMREFNDMPVTAWLFNAGHMFFLRLFNLLYWQSLKDPFSMFKVFRRDCLFGIWFECDRFDFDFELVIKLVRKGYQPVEIPVNYKARSFSEGKKVRVFRDPLTWLRALVKYRFVSLELHRCT